MNKMSFEGSGFEYFKIWIVNILLTLITIGIYYPWAKVRNKKYFYENTMFEGKNFEYLATGAKLFIAYLIAIVVLFVYSILGAILPFGNIILGFLLFLVLPWIIWRSMKFNMNVTKFSNVKFKFNGSLKKLYLILFSFALSLVAIFLVYLVIFTQIDITYNIWIILIMIIVALTAIVIAFAYFKAQQTKYFLNASSYGQASFNTSIETLPFVKISLQTFVIFLTSFLFFCVLIALSTYLSSSNANFSFINEILKNTNDLELLLIMLLSMLSVIIALYLSLVLSLIIASAYNIITIREYIFSNTKLDENIEFSSSMTLSTFVYIIVSNFFIILFTLGFGIPWAKVRLARYTISNTLILYTGDIQAFISQKEKQQSALGEELGDAFDIDVGVAL